MVLKGQECLLTRDLIVTSTLRFGGCRIYYNMKYLYDIYSHDGLSESTYNFLYNLSKIAHPNDFTNTYNITCCQLL